MAHMARVETQHLFDLARDKSVAAREALTATVSDLFFARGDVLTDRERSLMTEILRQLINDVESSVRRALAARLARQPDAPRDLVLALARDEITVAHAILIHSEVLRDDELIEIIQHRTLEHQLAVAMRKSVSEQVSDALVETGAVDVIKTLLENHGARISAATMDYLAEQSQRVDTYQNPLLRRPDLTPALARRMYWWVSAALRRHILANFAITPSDIDDALEAGASDPGALPAEQDQRKSERLAEALSDAAAITPDLLVQSLRRGEIALFEALFAKLTEIRPSIVRRMLYERGGEELAVACRATGIAPPLFASIFLLSRKARPNDPPPAQGELKRVQQFYAAIPLAAAGQLVKTWRRDDDFQKAMRQVDTPVADHATR
jgi:uncharacterized protein (DUF2336 family)